MGALAGLIDANPQGYRGEAFDFMFAPVMPRRGTEVEVAPIGATCVGTLRGRDTSLWSSTELAVAFYGVLDNEIELRSVLGAPGDGRHPAELVGRLILRRGYEAAVDVLRGAFAILVSDGERLTILRDHIGFRPLYFGLTGSGWAVATEAKQVAAALAKGPQPNIEFLENLMFGGDVSSTAYVGVERAPRAAVTYLEPSTPPRSVRYWHPDALLESSKVSSLEEAIEGLREKTRTAVERAITGSDAIALSGGLDSTTIAGFGAGQHLELSGRPLIAVSAVYPELPSVDESDLIRLMVEHSGLQLHTFQPQARPLDDLESWMELLDGPGTTLSMPEIVELHRVARGAGAEVLMTGELAEYVFGLRFQTLGHLLWNKRWSGLKRYVRYDRAMGRTWTSLAREAIRSIAPSRAYYLWSRNRSMETLPPWVDPGRVFSQEDRSNIPPAKDRWPAIQLQPALGDHAISFDNVDVAASLSGVTLRHPLVDRDLWDFCLSLPAELKFPTGQDKALMRLAVEGVVPPEIAQRRTKTFFDDAGKRNTSRPEIRKWIEAGDFRFGGVNYELLLERVETADLSMWEIDWVQNLVRCHAFLARWQ